MSVLKKQNRLADEKSPYLLQHAKNPVNWFPWGPEAFDIARKQDKPILLSIGYSTCHWCHVMAQESFEDEEVAELINNVFVAIKVDREERPDIDNLYMNYCQIMTGSGGWPLTLFLTPDKKPFYAATYLPKNNRYGRIGLLELISRIKKEWANKRNDLIIRAEKVTDLLDNYSKSKTDDFKKSLNITIFNEAYIDLKNNYDDVYGGFGTAPKFPVPHQNLFLINYYQYNKKNIALSMVENTLKKMRAGGIYDHIGYGFHRYSTDERWLVPHYEKMLYDQALLIYLYTTAYQVNKNPLYRKTVEEIIEYLKHNMVSIEGGFYSAEDADSEGEEGKFYLWSYDQITSILENNADKIIDLYNINKEGNFINEITGDKNGKNILHLRMQNIYLEFEKELELLEERKTIYKERDKRPHPHKDDKVLTDWNGLMIASLSKAAFVFTNNEYTQLAERAADFLIENMIDEKKLYHRYRESDIGIRATLNDYSFLCWGLLELYQDTFKIHYLEKAILLMNEMIEKFWDNSNGGFFLVSSEETELIVRNKEIYDGALPSGNSIAMMNLIRLSHLTGNHQYEEKADEMARCFAAQVKTSPESYCQFLISLQALILPYYDIIIVGKKDDLTTEKVLSIIRENYNQNISLILIPPEKDTDQYRKIKKSISFIENYKQIQNKTTIYICKNYSCKLPVTEPEDVLSLLKED